MAWDVLFCKDGTILNSSSNITADNVSAVKRLLDETNIAFVPATGKSRHGALKAMGELGLYLRQRSPNGVPGVFLQGLVVHGDNGHIIYENEVHDELSQKVVNIADLLNLTLIAYSRDSILCGQRDALTDLLPIYHVSLLHTKFLPIVRATESDWLYCSCVTNPNQLGCVHDLLYISRVQEPDPEPIGNWNNAIGSRTLNKFIFMATVDRIDEVRPFVQEKIGHIAKLTQAQGNMLEVLPLNASKGDGVRRLLDTYCIPTQSVMAIGDAENVSRPHGRISTTRRMLSQTNLIEASIVVADMPHISEHRSCLSLTRSRRISRC